MLINPAAIRIRAGICGSEKKAIAGTRLDHIPSFLSPFNGQLTLHAVCGLFFPFLLVFPVSPHCRTRSRREGCFDGHAGRMGNAIGLDRLTKLFLAWDRVYLRPCPWIVRTQFHFDMKTPDTHCHFTTVHWKIPFGRRPFWQLPYWNNP